MTVQSPINTTNGNDWFSLAWETLQSEQSDRTTRRQQQRRYIRAALAD